ncbi:MAG: hypothetical protein GY895_10435 [Phycisphaera sp.]|nr:hypothetical protein [Phycisphaera sp.]
MTNSASNALATCPPVSSLAQMSPQLTADLVSVAITAALVATMLVAMHLRLRSQAVTNS